MEEDKKEIIEIEKTNNNENTKMQNTQVKAKEEPKKERNGFCIASMVLGIVALVFFCVWYLSIPCGILAVIFGILGMKSKNKAMAITGLITGSIGLVVSILIVIILFMVAFTFGIYDGFSEIEDSIEYNNYYDI